MGHGKQHLSKIRTDALIAVPRFGKDENVPLTVLADFNAQLGGILHTMLTCVLHLTGEVLASICQLSTKYLRWVNLFPVQHSNMENQGERKPRGLDFPH